LPDGGFGCKLKISIERNRFLVQTQIMTCPYCHLVSSRYAEICAHCGASLRRVDTDSPHQLPLPFLPPAPQLPLPSTVAPLPRREIAPMPAPPRRVRVVRWNGVSITALLLGSACLGYGVRQIVLGSRAVLLAVVSSSDKGVTPSQAQTMPSFQNIAPPVQAPPAYMPGLAFPEPMPPLSALRPADRNDVPPFASLGGSPLRLQNINLVPRRTRLQITERYDEWKQSHGEGADEVGHYMAFYAPEARVFDTPGRQMSLSQLRALAIEVRNQGTYAKVLDQKPLQWGKARAASGSSCWPFTATKMMAVTACGGNAD